MTKIRITESELRDMVRKCICEAIEESGYLQGAHKATLDNLNHKKNMGILTTYRPIAKKHIPNDERLRPLETHNQDMNEDFFKIYGNNIVIPFSVTLNDSFIYNFDFKLSKIENIDSKFLSIIGDMEVTRTIGNPESFMNAFCPRIKENVVLKYSFSDKYLKYPRNPKGIKIKPALNSSGENNNRWNQLITYASDYLRGIERYSRP